MPNVLRPVPAGLGDGTVRARAVVLGAALRFEPVPRPAAEAARWRERELARGTAGLVVLAYADGVRELVATGPGAEGLARAVLE
ncbi:hypothetical protein AB0M71_47445, partial [Amycolatopsis sp. NPDC051114]